MSTEHLILGETVDFITGETVVDTHDERARQQIARFLVERKGYSKKDIETRRNIALALDDQQGVVRVDFVIRLQGNAFAIVQFGPGSLVSRERSASAAARLVEPYVVPYAVVTNGKDAEVLETRSGKVISEGLDTVPCRDEALKMMEALVFEQLSAERLAKEKRVLFTFEVLAERECDEYTCNL
jgi:hypothetical protein